MSRRCSCRASAFMKLANQEPDLAARVADRIRQELTGYLGEIERVKTKIGAARLAASDR